MRNRISIILSLGLILLSASSLAMVSFKAADEKFQTPINRLELVDAYEAKKMMNSELSIQKSKMQPLPLGSIRPAGWLYNQLHIQAEGLSGHLDEFWPDIKDSGWFGGDSDAWERAPYWLDGIVPLAYLLNDPGLKDKVTKYMDYIIVHQDETGWMGKKQDQSKYDLWAIFLVLKPLVQYYEATGDDRIPGVV